MHGTTNLNASYGGFNASKTVRVVNDYSGDWVGSYVVKSCQGSSVFGEGGCHAGRIGEVMPIRLTLEQIGSSQSEVSGSLELDRVLTGSIGAAKQNVTGVVNAEGLTLNGTGKETAWDDTYFFKIEAWQTTLSGRSGMTGRWTQHVALGAYGDPNSIFANAHQENELVTLTRPAAGP